MSADPIERMVPYRARGGITRWEPPKVEAAPRATSRPRKRIGIVPAEEPLKMPASVATCSCGCLLARADELCPSCGVPWAERDAVRASWAGEWWAA